MKFIRTKHVFFFLPLFLVPEKEDEEEELISVVIPY